MYFMLNTIVKELETLRLSTECFFHFIYSFHEIMLKTLVQPPTRLQPNINQFSITKWLVRQSAQFDVKTNIKFVFPYHIFSPNQQYNKKNKIQQIFYIIVLHTLERNFTAIIIFFRY